MPSRSAASLWGSSGSRSAAGMMTSKGTHRSRCSAAFTSRRACPSSVSGSPGTDPRSTPAPSGLVQPRRPPPTAVAGRTRSQDRDVSSASRSPYLRRRAVRGVGVGQRPPHPDRQRVRYRFVGGHHRGLRWWSGEVGAGEDRPGRERRWRRHRPVAGGVAGSQGRHPARHPARCCRCCRCCRRAGAEGGRHWCCHTVITSECGRPAGERETQVKEWAAWGSNPEPKD